MTQEQNHSLFLPCLLFPFSLLSLLKLTAIYLLLGQAQVVSPVLVFIPSYAFVMILKSAYFKPPFLLIMLIPLFIDKPPILYNGPN